MDKRPGSSRVICLTRQPGIGQSLFMPRSMGSDASPSKPQPRPAQSTQTAGEPLHRGEAHLAEDRCSALVVADEPGVLRTQNAPNVLLGVRGYDGERDPACIKPPQEVARAREQADAAGVAGHERAHMVRD